MKTAAAAAVAVLFVVGYTGFPRLLESPGFFFFKIPGTGKSRKITLVLESPGKVSLTITRH